MDMVIQWALLDLCQLFVSLSCTTYLTDDRRILFTEITGTVPRLCAVMSSTEERRMIRGQLEITVKPHNEMSEVRKFPAELIFTPVSQMQSANWIWPHYCIATPLKLDHVIRITFVEDRQ